MWEIAVCVREDAATLLTFTFTTESCFTKDDTSESEASTNTTSAVLAMTRITCELSLFAYNIFGRDESATCCQTSKLVLHTQHNQSKTRTITSQSYFDAMAKEDIYADYVTDMEIDQEQDVANNENGQNDVEEEEEELENALRSALQTARGEDVEEYENMHPFWPEEAEPYGYTGALSPSSSSASSDHYISYCQFVLDLTYVLFLCCEVAC